YVRAGDLIVIDCRTSHRGRNATTEGKDMLSRALYFPFNRGAPGLTFKARRRLWRFTGKPERHIVTLLFGRPNEFSREYMQTVRRVLKQRYPHPDVDVPLPRSWREALDSAGIGY